MGGKLNFFLLIDVIDGIIGDYSNAKIGRCRQKMNKLAGEKLERST